MLFFSSFDEVKYKYMIKIINKKETFLINKKMNIINEFSSLILWNDLI